MTPTELKEILKFPMDENDSGADTVPIKKRPTSELLDTTLRQIAILSFGTVGHPELVLRK